MKNANLTYAQKKNLTKETLAKEDKKTVILFPSSDLKKGDSVPFQINGYIYQVMVGEQVSVPVSVAALIEAYTNDFSSIDEKILGVAKVLKTDKKK